MEVSLLDSASVLKATDPAKYTTDSFIEFGMLSSNISNSSKMVEDNAHVEAAISH